MADSARSRHPAARWSASARRLTRRVKELAERYETPLPQMTERVNELEAKVNRHLERMGFRMEVKPGYKQTEVGVIPEDWEVATIGAIGCNATMEHQILANA